MKRLFEDKLMKWKLSDNTKPLMVLGVRQIGKTYTIDKFCKDNFEEYLYFNLEQDKHIFEIFEESIEPDEILKNIELKINKIACNILITVCTKNDNGKH